MKKVILFSCLLGLGSLMSCEQDTEPTSQTDISGAAVKGHVNKAKVNVYAYGSDGERGVLLSSTTTNSIGEFNISTDYRGSVEIVVTQGEYADEATGDIVQLDNNELRAITFANARSQVAGVSALTTVAAAYVDAHATMGLEIAIKEANDKVANAFGLAGIDISKEIPADLSQESSSSTEAQAKYGAVQAGLSQVVKENGLSAEVLLSLINDISIDFSDGILDGKSASGTLETVLTLAPEEAMVGLNTAITNFLSGSMNASSHTSSSIDINIPAPQGGGN